MRSSILVDWSLFQPFLGLPKDTERVWWFLGVFNRERVDVIRWSGFDNHDDEH